MKKNETSLANMSAYIRAIFTTLIFNEYRPIHLHYIRALLLMNVCAFGREQ